MNDKRQEKIAKRRADMPRQYRATYDKAVSGKSRKAAQQSFCLECCGWQIKEVYLCTAVACSLWPYRQEPRASQSKPEDNEIEPESKNSEQSE